METTETESRIRREVKARSFFLRLNFDHASYVFFFKLISSCIHYIAWINLCNWHKKESKKYEHLSKNMEILIFYKWAYNINVRRRKPERLKEGIL
jgi:hypothetical protein